MKIGFKDFWIDLSINNVIGYVKAILQWTWEAFNMVIPIWLFLILLFLIYIYIWRQAIWKWKLQQGLESLCIQLFDVKQRFFTSQNIEENLKNDLLKILKNRELFPWLPPSINKPKFFKPHKWRIL